MTTEYDIERDIYLDSLSEDEREAYELNEFLSCYDNFLDKLEKDSIDLRLQQLCSNGRVKHVRGLL